MKIGLLKEIGKLMRTRKKDWQLRPKKQNKTLQRRVKVKEKERAMEIRMMKTKTKKRKKLNTKSFMIQNRSEKRSKPRKGMLSQIFLKKEMLWQIKAMDSWDSKKQTNSILKIGRQKSKLKFKLERKRKVEKIKTLMKMKRMKLQIALKKKSASSEKQKNLRKRRVKKRSYSFRRLTLLKMILSPSSIKWAPHLQNLLLKDPKEGAKTPNLLKNEISLGLIIAI